MGKLTCTLEMDHEKGLTLKVEDPDGKLSQTITFDGQAITLEVKSDSDTSTIVQKADSITMSCKAFSVKADTITLESKKDSAWKSEQVLQLESKKDMTLTSGEKLTQQAKKGASFSSDDTMEVKAAKDFTLEGMNVQLSAPSGALELKAKSLAMKGTAEAALEAATVKVSAKAELALESTGQAKLKGTMTTVSGTPVSLG
ncbi:DUF2345 domain-containing protein [Archangium primigenium]|uniref:DUF2345 domain-containing protein n=1 Tax=[Archangium] primigenium TaxID=2792470 RepID=UPI001957D60F|nr:DUF2345 domain-containing protein [Archangium primigenium]MBM7118739.1 DUF2345 domain-containing protein [Archangium primigenium]